MGDNVAMMDFPRREVTLERAIKDKLFDGKT